ncbi:conserved hypothetical protein [Culex quinquefasciatus]|uniref:Uncharacterized protein n=1 Tax=Culex quinquefasciatus TaxID=7176 RepID=B0XHW0_CULQU|nr:conserved hypothetical protein [Culex quinquefasciatus]|eukprot:XP_001869232.1 conserved hypothetical protein [Culex quinquefasciatus]
MHFSSLSIKIEYSIPLPTFRRFIQLSAKISATLSTQNNEVIPSLPAINTKFHLKPQPNHIFVPKLLSADDDDRTPVNMQMAMKIDHRQRWLMAVASTSVPCRVNWAGTRHPLNSIRQKRYCLVIKLYGGAIGSVVHTFGRELGPFRIPHSKDPERIPFPEKARSYLFRGSIPSVRAGRHGVQQYTIISLGEGESNLLSAGTVPFFELAGEVNNRCSAQIPEEEARIQDCSSEFCGAGLRGRFGRWELWQVVEVKCRNSEKVRWVYFVEFVMSFRLVDSEKVKSQESRVKSQESRVKSQESRVKSQESRVKSQESRVKSQESRVKSQESLRVVKSQESRVKSQESRVKSQESRVKSQESRVKSQESRVKSQESRVKSQESRVKSQESRVKSQESRLSKIGHHHVSDVPELTASLPATSGALGAIPTPLGKTRPLWPGLEIFANINLNGSARGNHVFPQEFLESNKREFGRLK